MKCRHCSKELTNTFLDLGFAPPSNAYLTEEDLSKSEKFYPLRVMVCDECWLAQTEDYAQAEELFSSEYAYFSSTSTSWLKHAAQYSNRIIKELSLNDKSFVIEIASNDGYLLKNFVEAGVPCLGIEPTDSTAKVAEEKNIQVVREFFSESLADELSNQNKKADLIIGNNVYAHVPDINDFTKGLKKILNKKGTITLEFPHLMKLINNNQFDTIYHEHFSYLSLYTVSRIFRSHGLRIFNVEEIKTHGGSIRVFGCHEDDKRKEEKELSIILKKESDYGLQNIETYKNFKYKVQKIKNEFVKYLIKKYDDGKKVAAYGAAAKGNTLLNYAGVKRDLLTFVCDAAKAKQEKFMPGSHIPIRSPDALSDEIVDCLVILPWNLASEIKIEINKLVANEVEIVTFIPELKIIN